MALNNTTADAVGAAIASALGVEDASAVANWKTMMRQIYAGIKSDIAITASVPLNSINTTGTAAAQVGPPAPVATNVTVN